MKGSCLCGSLRYEISGALKFIGNCHCSICRKSNGAAYASWGIIDPAQFQWTAGEELLHAYRSSPATERCFCSRCGSPLVARHGAAITEIVVATLDEDPGMRPSEHIFVGSKAPWHEITDVLPRYDEWPPET